MDISTQIVGEQISQAVAAKASAQEILERTERAPNKLVDFLAVAGPTWPVAFIWSHMSTWKETACVVIATVALNLAMVSYQHILSQRKRLDAMLILLRQTTP